MASCQPSIHHVFINTTVTIINVARGPIIEENSLIENLENGHIKSVALDVFEKEPLSLASPLIHNKNTILGSHNASNTFEAVTRTSQKALEIIYKLILIILQF